MCIQLADAVNVAGGSVYLAGLAAASRKSGREGLTFR
jgi:hypothetical protein